MSKRSFMDITKNILFIKKKKKQAQAGRMAQWVKVFVSTVGNLSSISRLHKRWEGPTSPSRPLMFTTCTGVRAHTYTLTHK